MDNNRAVTTLLLSAEWFHHIGAPRDLSIVAVIPTGGPERLRSLLVPALSRTRPLVLLCLVTNALPNKIEPECGGGGFTLSERGKAGRVRLNDAFRLT